MKNPKNPKKRKSKGLTKSQILEILEMDPNTVLSPLPPRSLSKCHTIHDVALLVFGRAELNGNHQMLKDDEGNILRLVWPGREFSDELIADILSQLSSLPDASRLKELRLVATSLSAEMIQSLRNRLPGTKIVEIDSLTSQNNWRWTQAKYPESKEFLGEED